MTRLMTFGAVAVAALAISSLAGASRSTIGSPAGCGKRLVYTFAHPDDVLLFMMPAVSNNLAAGDCVRLVDLTAGDAGTGSAAYWEGREQGLRVALAAIANEPDHWTERSARIPGHPATFWKLVGNPKLTLIFLHLPDGQSEGLGFGRTGYQSLYKLWERKIPSMTTLDTNSSYTRSGLIQTLAGLITDSGATTVGTQNYDAPFTTVSPHDHFDHIAAALFTKAAIQINHLPVTLIGYQDYSISALSQNLTPTQVAQKQNAFEAYVPHDNQVQTVCQTPAACSTSNFAPYWSREYPLPPIRPG